MICINGCFVVILKSPPPPKEGTTNLQVGGQCIGRWGVNTVKTLKFEKGGGVHNPPSSYRGATPAPPIYH